MVVGLWNIDHPETGSGKTVKEKRFQDVRNYLVDIDCDAYIITEANSAMKIPGYAVHFSQISPFKSSSRYYGSPNTYHQVAIYSKTPIKVLVVEEPVNGLCCEFHEEHPIKTLYGNVITIKDQWSPTSGKTYSERLEEQIQAIHGLPTKRTLAGGDFNLRKGWKQKQSALRRLEDSLAHTPWCWPTVDRDDTVQHVIHSPDVTPHIELDHNVKYAKGSFGGLSDHPFMRISIT